ncbi:MAG: RIO kinase 1 [Bradymonadia bacterium]
MRLPPRLIPLLDEGIIDGVVRPLMSGKEAQVYLVESGGELRAAKVYKDANHRSFKNRSGYTEGRTVRNSRDRRAMQKRSRHGRERDEESWISAEADIIYRLDAAGVRVPKPYAFVEGVLVMECIQGSDGGPAPRLAECSLGAEQSAEIFHALMREVATILSADLVHGDLSAFNVLLEPAGPVVIDFPQAIDATKNRSAKTILLRDIANLTSHLMSGTPRNQLRHGHEMWDLYERGELRRDAVLTGRFNLPQHEVDAELLLEEMLEIEEDEATAPEDGDYEFVAPKKETPKRTGARVVKTADPNSPPPSGSGPRPGGRNRGGRGRGGGRR